MTQTPFYPIGQTRALYYLHIPKTSGSAQNTQLQALFGADNCIVHAESWFSAIRAGQKPAMAADCVSGHIPWRAWQQDRLDQHYAGMTVLRAPWARLVSHVNWMDRFNQGVDPDTHARLPQKYRDVVAALGRTDFHDTGSLEQMRADLQGTAGAALFDNLHVRMLAATVAPDRETLDARDLMAAIDTLRGFALIGFAEDQATLGMALAHWLDRPVPAPVTEQVNPARSHRLRVDNDVARTVLAPWYAQDAALIAAARELPGAAVPAPPKGWFSRLLRRE